MNSYVQKLIRLNNNNQRPVIPECLRRDDWRYQVMELSGADLNKELSSWSREKMINWLDWNDPNGIWTDEDAEAEGYKPLTQQGAKDYLIQILSQDNQ